jgi:hypothetical protein
MSAEQHAVAPGIMGLFPAMPARAAMRAAMKEVLDALKSQQYTWELVKESTKPIADLCRERLKGALGLLTRGAPAAAVPLNPAPSPLPPSLPAQPSARRATSSLCR